MVSRISRKSESDNSSSQSPNTFLKDDSVEAAARNMTLVAMSVIFFISSRYRRSRTRRKEKKMANASRSFSVSFAGSSSASNLRIEVAPRHQLQRAFPQCCGLDFQMNQQKNRTRSRHRNLWLCLLCECRLAYIQPAYPSDSWRSSSDMAPGRNAGAASWSQFPTAFHSRSTPLPYCRVVNQQLAP